MSRPDSRLPAARLRVTAEQMAALRPHLFPGDRDEHGAVLLAGVREDADSVNLLARELHLLDDRDFPPGVHGYRQFAPDVLARLGVRAHAENLALLTLHSHPRSTHRVSLSPDDLAGHARVFGHLLDIVASPIGGVAMGSHAADGEVWLDRERRVRLERVDVVGERTETLRASPPAGVAAAAGRYDRQVRMFGAEGQARLRDLRVAVVGVGGGGSLAIEQLAHLGVGEIVAIDYDRVAEHNLSRIVGASAADARAQTKKVAVAERLVARINPDVRLTPVDGNVADRDVAELVARCDFIVLAGDSHTSRLVVNAIAHANLIPAVQIGAKVDTRPDGSIEQIYCAVRPTMPPQGCLRCAQAIDQTALQRENASDEERTAQDYLGRDSGVTDPSVITLNAVGAAAAMTVLLLSTVGLGQSGLAAHRLHTPADGGWLTLQVPRDEQCPWCSGAAHSQFARGGSAALPVRLSASR